MEIPILKAYYSTELSTNEKSKWNQKKTRNVDLTPRFNVWVIWVIQLYKKVTNLICLVQQNNHAMFI